MTDTKAGRWPMTGRRVFLWGAAAAVAMTQAAVQPAVAQQAGGTLRIVQGADAQPGNVLAGRAGNNPWRFNVTEPLTMLDPSWAIRRRSWRRTGSRARTG